MQHQPSWVFTKDALPTAFVTEHNGASAESGLVIALTMGGLVLPGRLMFRVTQEIYQLLEARQTRPLSNTELHTLHQFGHSVHRGTFYEPSGWVCDGMKFLLEQIIAWYQVPDPPKHMLPR